MERGPFRPSVNGGNVFTSFLATHLRHHNDKCLFMEYVKPFTSTRAEP